MSRTHLRIASPAIASIFVATTSPNFPVEGPDAAISRSTRPRGKSKSPVHFWGSRWG